MIAQATRDRIDARAEALWPRMVALQQAYFAKHGCFWQGMAMRTKATDLVRFPSDRVTPEKAHYEGPPHAAVKVVDAPAVPHDWNYLGVNPANLPADFEAHIRVDVFRSQAGHGYTVTLSKIDSGDVLCERSRTLQPDGTVTDVPWHEVGGS
jgi:hypothetical protein